jgi:hypothetical protein
MTYPMQEFYIGDLKKTTDLFLVVLLSIMKYGVLAPMKQQKLSF